MSKADQEVLGRLISDMGYLTKEKIKNRFNPKEKVTEKEVIKNDDISDSDLESLAGEYEGIVEES